MSTTDEPRWSREEVQRVLYTVVRAYEQANSRSYDKAGIIAYKRDRKGILRRRTRHSLFRSEAPKPILGGDSELLRDAIRIAKQTLKDNNWWPEDDKS